MAHVTLYLKRRWWFWPALVAGAVAGRLGLIKPKPSGEYVDGVMPAQHRLARWLADHAMEFRAD